MRWRGERGGSRGQEGIEEGVRGRGKGGSRGEGGRRGGEGNKAKE